MLNCDQKMKAQLSILYGSQTGNAEDMSKRIGYQAKRLGFNVLVEAIDDFDIKLLPKQDTVIFVCSTTGHGQEPENMKNLYNFIRRRDLPAGCLSKIKFAVYGLGDSSYSKFNYVSKILFKRLKECGAKPIQDLVMGDEQHPLGCDGIIYPKLGELWSILNASDVSDKQDDNDTDSKLPETAYTSFKYPIGDPGPWWDGTTWRDICDVPMPEDVFEDKFVARYNMQTAYCVTNKRLTPDTHFQDTRLLCFRTDQPIDYEPGDVCAILPANTAYNVTQFLNILNLSPNQRFKLRKKDQNYMVNYLYDFIPDGLEIGQLVKYYLDIQSIPKRSFFEFLWPLSNDILERDKLKELASTEGQQEMYEYCIQPKRSILEVLLDFPFTVKKIQFEYLFDLIPPIKPRSFSIASASCLHPQEIQLIVGVVKYRTRMRKLRLGLCSNYLAQLVPIDRSGSAGPENELKFFIKKSAFKLPQNKTTQIVLIGPGLGIAPLRSFIEERAKNYGQLSNVYLYFGCRYRKADYYFQPELEQYVVENNLRLQVAFSREEPKQYVQDLLIADSELLKKLILFDSAVIYVAGNSKLPEDLRKLLCKILVDESGDTENSIEGEKLVANLESQNRIQYDCW